MKTLRNKEPGSSWFPDHLVRCNFARNYEFAHLDDFLGALQAQGDGLGLCVGLAEVGGHPRLHRHEQDLLDRVGRQRPESGRRSQGWAGRCQRVGLIRVTGLGRAGFQICLALSFGLVGFEGVHSQKPINPVPCNLSIEKT